jgi:hypothetical protein
MRQLLDSRPISMHMSLVDAKLFAVRISDRQGNFPSCLARCSSTSLVIAAHPGPVRITGWAAFAAAVAALFCAAGVAPPPPPPPPACGVVTRGGVRFAAKIGLNCVTEKYIKYYLKAAALLLNVLERQEVSRRPAYYSMLFCYLLWYISKFILDDLFLYLLYRFVSTG